MYLERCRSEHLLRRLNVQDDACLNFSSNDYLALSKNTDSLEEGVSAAKMYGTGSTGSRLLSGNKKIFEEFERIISRDKNTESALVFNSGYIANQAVIAAFVFLGYQLIFDKLNHASMYQGTNSRNLQRFKHLNYEHLERLLEQTPGKKAIVSETIFGMDGDKADIAQLAKLAEKYDTMLYLDETHATGLYGQNGFGLSTNFQLDKQRTIIMGTFSKALASAGAYVACAEKFKELLIQISKGFIYSTALPPFCIGVARYNWAKLPLLGEARNELANKADYLREKLREREIRYIGDQTNIIPIVYDNTENMMAVLQELLRANIVASAIRRPTSPTPRIRIAINASHTYDDLDNLIRVLKKIPMTKKIRYLLCHGFGFSDDFWKNLTSLLDAE